MKKDKILDRKIETMEPEELTRTIVEPKLARQIRRVIRTSHFYRRKFRHLKVKELESLPFTEKGEIIEDQLKAPPFGTNLCVGIGEIQRVHRTAGSTGRPVFVAITKKDLETIVRTGRRCFWASGLRSDDVVIHCLNYCLWAGGYTDHQSLEATGAAVIPYGAGNSHGLIEAILHLKPSSIHCTPSYLSKLEILLESDFGLVPKDLGLRKGFFGGEGGLQNPRFRSRLEKRWGIVAMNANYGLSEVHSMFAAECGARDGLHFMAQEYLLPELIEPTSGKPVEIRKGNVGELVLTHLEHEAQPLIRFRTHDSIRIVDHGVCRCGRTSFRFKVAGRSDDMLVVKGINLYPEAIKEILGEFAQFTGEYQVIAAVEEPIVGLDLRIEVEKGSEGNGGLKKKILGRLKESLMISPVIHLVRKGGIPRTDGKTRRVIRKKV
jgi:phenylacetate-CoA ligase